jgi:hypothetical protein
VHCFCVVAVRLESTISTVLLLGDICLTIFFCKMRIIKVYFLCNISIVWRTVLSNEIFQPISRLSTNNTPNHTTTPPRLHQRLIRMGGVLHPIPSVFLSVCCCLIGYVVVLWLENRCVLLVVIAPTHIAHARLGIHQLASHFITHYPYTPLLHKHQKKTTFIIKYTFQYTLKKHAYLTPITSPNNPQYTHSTLYQPYNTSLTSSPYIHFT